MTSDQSYDSLQQMLECCRKMQELLKNDVELFGSNNLALIEESNTIKAELLSKLNSLAAGTKINTDNIADESSSLLAELRSEVMTCYKYITTNSNIVFYQMQQIKEIWDKLATRKSENYTYDQNGNTVK